MDKPIFIIEMPDLTDEAVSSIQDFIWDLLVQFESSYYHQLQRHHRRNNKLKNPLF